MTIKQEDRLTSQAIVESFQSRNLNANVVDVLDRLASSTRRISLAICDDACPGTDATGGKVGCMVEATMGVTAGLVRIADAIADLAEAVRDSHTD